VAAEVDRVLDKINEKGIGSLTQAERRFLDEVAKQKNRRTDPGLLALQFLVSYCPAC